MITIYTVTYNEELLIQFMIDHYRTRFPGCRIVVNDNMSTDNTAEIALFNGCEVTQFDSNNQFEDRYNMDFKNNCWKDAKTDWVLMCDLDELADINEEQLKTEEDSGTSMVKFEVYDMINMKDNLNFSAMKYGVKSPADSKYFLFNKKFIREINYSPGAHACNPAGKVVYSQNIYKVYHYASINTDLTIEKFKIRQKRLCPENIKMGWGVQVFMTPEEIRKEYAEERSKAIKVR